MFRSYVKKRERKEHKSEAISQEEIDRLKHLTESE